MKNKKGFTLIELLAVITIMGILMMVAIPAVSRTIENSRRDTFGDVALNYVNVVRNAALADELLCTPSTNGVYGTGEKKYAALKDGIYVFYIATSEDAIAPKSGSTNGQTDLGLTQAQIKQATLDLMESGGKSSWGGNDVYGYVVWKKQTNANAQVDTTYAVLLRDIAKHGMDEMVLEEKLTRTSVSSTLSSSSTENADKLDTAFKETTVFGDKDNNGAVTATGKVAYVCKLE